MSKDNFRHRVLAPDSRLITGIVTRFRWLGHVLYMSAHRLTFCALFASADQGWMNRRLGPAMTW